MDLRKDNDVLLLALSFAIRDQEEFIRCYDDNKEGAAADARKIIRAFKRVKAKLEKRSG
jgi:hypothetical protein